MCPNKAILLYLGAKCPNSETEAVEVFGNISSAVRLNCGDIGSDTSIIWRYELTTTIINHTIGSDPVYFDEARFPVQSMSTTERIIHSLSLISV